MSKRSAVAIRSIAQAAVLGLVAIVPLDTANAASSSVSVSITFETAPNQMFRAPAIAPDVVQSCLDIQGKIDMIWWGLARKPELACLSASHRPLLVSESTARGSVVRP